MRGLNRKKRIKLILRVIFYGTVLIHIAHALTLDRIIQYKEVSFYSPDAPAEMNGYRIAFIADTHELPEKYLQKVADELNKKQIDLLLLGGDFPRADDVLRSSMEILSQIETAGGIFGVEGNHDRRRALFAAMEEYSITPLSNSGLYIRDNFYLAGVEDLWGGSPSIADAIEGSQPDDFVLLLSHNPDVSMKQDTTGVDLILSGHTHGGQITFFGFWAPYLSFRDSITEYGHRFKSGWALSRDGTPVYVTKGTGDYVFRVFARRQVILITFKTA
jgi:hypothetical protein